MALSAILAADDVVSKAESDAAIKAELDWQHHWADKHQAGEVEIFRLRQLLDLAAATRAGNVLELVRDVNGGKSGTHDDTCHHRHAACLARKVREALTLDGGAER
jgi:hypothetical protein